jgi:proteasome lid subunit RPN8/RPN11
MIDKLPEKIIEEIKEHASRVYPRECCGLVLVVKGKYRYYPCTNIAPDGNNQFIMSPDDWMAAEDLGTPTIIVHSHPNASPMPSQADLVGCEKSQLPWLIVNWPVGTMHYFEPSGYVLPLIGREFIHGLVDCYTLIRDYYKQELGITLLDFYRADEWWAHGENLYLDNYERTGFTLILDGEPQKHDMLYMQVGSQVPNHGAVYLGDGTILHHQYNRLSSKDVYGGWYKKVTSHIMRYKDFL